MDDAEEMVALGRAICVTHRMVRRVVKRRSQLEVFHPPMMATISGRGAQVIGLSSRTPPPKRPTVHVRIPKNGMTYRLDIQVIEEVIGSCTERS
jgi:hypothetical protein